MTFVAVAVTIGSRFGVDRPSSESYNLGIPVTSQALQPWIPSSAPMQGGPAGGSTSVDGELDTEISPGDNPCSSLAMPLAEPHSPHSIIATPWKVGCCLAWRR